MMAWPTVIDKGTHRVPKGHQTVLQESEPPELRTVAVTNLTRLMPLIVNYERFSSWAKLLRTIAFCMRYLKNCRVRIGDRSLEPLSTDELFAAKMTLLKEVQPTHFREEIGQLKAGHPLKHNSKLLCLNPFLDDKGLMRVGGRLRNSDVQYSAQHQIVLPTKHRLTKLIIAHEHAKQLHAGTEGTLAAIRQQFWPLAAKTTVLQSSTKGVCANNGRPSQKPSSSDKGIYHLRHRLFWSPADKRKTSSKQSHHKGVRRSLSVLCNQGSTL